MVSKKEPPKQYKKVTLTFGIPEKELFRVCFTVEADKESDMRAFLSLHDCPPDMRIIEVDSGDGPKVPLRKHTAIISFFSSQFCFYSAEFYAEEEEAKRLAEAINCCMIMPIRGAVATIMQGKPDDVI